MSDNMQVTPGTGALIALDEVADPTLGTVKVQYNKIMDGTLDSTNKLVVDSQGRIGVTESTGGGKTLLFGAINTATTGNNTLVAASISAKIKVVSYALISYGTVNAKFMSGVTNLTGPVPLVANSGIAMTGTPISHLFETAVNNALILNLSVNVQVVGHFSYFVE